MYIYIMCIYIYVWKNNQQNITFVGKFKYQNIDHRVLPESSRNGPPQATEALPVPSSCLETVTTEDRGCLTVDIGEKDGKKMEDAIYIYLLLLSLLLLYIYTYAIYVPYY